MRGGGKYRKRIVVKVHPNKPMLDIIGVGINMKKGCDDANRQ